jgi:hypothetical protein
MLHLTRAYASAENAERTVSRLKSLGFSDDMLHVAKPGTARQVWSVSVEFPFGMGRTVTDILDRFDPIEGSDHALGADYGARGMATPFHGRAASREPDLESISRLSQPKPVGAIRELSKSKSPGAISRLSQPKPVGAIAKWSGRVNPGSISRLSGPRPVGAIAPLSGPTRSATIAQLSAGWALSKVFGIPLLTRSQAPLEPDSSLLAGTRPSNRR